MDPIDLHQTRLQLLQEQAGHADDRIAELNQELLLHRGGSQHLGQVMSLIEGHRARLAGHAKDQADKGEALKDQAEAEHKACIAGIVDALTYLRAQTKSAELSATRVDAALQEMGRHRTDLSAQGRKQAGKLDALMAELDKGVPREMVGRPEPAEAVRKKIDAARVARAAALPAEPAITAKRAVASV